MFGSTKKSNNAPSSQLAANLKQQAQQRLAKLKTKVLAKHAGALPQPALDMFVGGSGGGGNNDASRFDRSRG
jgi:hypothetical protein